MALSVLKQKIKTKSYMHFAEFVRDCALVGIILLLPLAVVNCANKRSYRSHIMRKPIIDRNRWLMKMRSLLKYVASFRIHIKNIAKYATF